MNATFCSALALCTLFSGLLSSLSAACINVGISLNRRVSLYIPIETLLLLCIVYAFRYRVIFSDLLSLNYFSYKADLFVLLIATWNVHTNQQRVSVPKRTDSNQDAACDGKEVEPVTATLAQPSLTKAKQEHLVGFNPSLFRRTIIWALIPALYIGDHSLLSRLMARAYDRPVAPFWGDVFIQLHFVVAMLELSAVQLLLNRMLALRRAQVHMLPPPEADLNANGITEEVWKSRLSSPKAIWAFAWCTQLAAALSLPALIVGMVCEVKKSGELDNVLLYNTIGAGMQVISFAVYLLFYRHFGRAKIQLRDDDEKVTASTAECSA